MVFWCGTFHGAAGAGGSIASQVAVLLFCLFSPGIQDPLELGRSGRLLAVAGLVVVAVSYWTSPVGRAGLVGLTLLPAYLVIPSSTARFWEDPKAQRTGSVWLATLTLLVSSTALIRWLTLDLPRAALPLGHHNLLAGWLVLVLPLTLATTRFPGLPRWLGTSAGILGLITMAATGSLLGATAITVQIILAAFWWKRLRPWLVPGLLTLSTLALPRLLAIWESMDLSALARWSYLEAGWRGVRARPMFGWGPGSVPWTIGEFLRPAAGVHPASQVVGDLHSLPLQLAYEIGIPGTLLTLAVAAVFLLRRWRESRRPIGALTRRAALLGLLGGAIFVLGAAPLSVPALPATIAVVAGIAMSHTSRESSRYRLPVLLAYVLLAAALLAPMDRAHSHYDQARLASDKEESLRQIDRALSMDPKFPLYRARRSWLVGEIRGVDAPTADQALQAAQAAPGLAPLWLAAGDLGRRAGLLWAPAALSTAHRLDPLSPLAAFHLMMVETDSDAAARLGETAVSLDPRLTAARWWWDEPGLADRVSQRTDLTIPNPIESPGGVPLVLALTLDQTPAVSFSLFAFRRSPWPGRLAAIPMGSDESIDRQPSIHDHPNGDTIGSRGPEPQD